MRGQDSMSDSRSLFEGYLKDMDSDSGSALCAGLKGTQVVHDRRPIAILKCNKSFRGRSTKSSKRAW